MSLEIFETNGDSFETYTTKLNKNFTDLDSDIVTLDKKVDTLADNLENLDVSNADTADKLTTARTIRTNLASTANASFDGSANVVAGVTGTLPIANGGTGNTLGQAVSASTLVTARTFRTNLSATANQTFNGSANCTLGVTGTLPLGYGGTGVTSMSALITALNNNGLTSGTSLDGHTNTQTRLGTLSSTTGSYAVGIGYNAVASGYYSVALGYAANASGDYSTALGRSTIGGGASSIALGSAAISGGASSIALGRSAKGGGASSIALGLSANASGDQSTAVGYVAKGGGASSIALGSSANASGDLSTALGFSANASGDYSTAVGAAANASGYYSVALGYGAIGGGASSIALGYGAKASGDYSTALGYRANATTEGYIQIGNSSYTEVVRIATSSLTTTSDERDKADITPLSDSLEFLSKIEPQTYVYNQREAYQDSELEEKIRELEDKLKPDDSIPEFIIDPETGEEVYNPEYNMSTPLSAEDDNALMVLKEKMARRNKFGLSDYDHEAHERGDKKGERRRGGVMAQQIQQAMIETYGTDNYVDLVINNLYKIDDSEIPEEAESQLGVNYTNFIPFLIDGVNRLSAQNQEQETEIAELKANYTALEERIKQLEG